MCTRSLGPRKMTTRQGNSLQIGDCVSIRGYNGRPIYGTVVCAQREVLGSNTRGWQLVIVVEHIATKGDSRYPTRGSRQLVQRTTYKAETVGFALVSRPISKQAAGSKRAMRATSRRLSDSLGPAVQKRSTPPRPGNRPGTHDASIAVPAGSGGAAPPAAPPSDVDAPPCRCAMCAHLRRVARGLISDMQTDDSYMQTGEEQGEEGEEVVIVVDEDEEEAEEEPAASPAAPGQGGEQGESPAAPGQGEEQGEDEEVVAIEELLTDIPFDLLTAAELQQLGDSLANSILVCE